MAIKKKRTEKKDKEIMKYVNYPWSYTIKPEEDYYVVYVNELPRIATHGATPDEAMRNVKEVIYSAVEAMLAEGIEIPVPLDPSKYKGNIPYRTSSDIHYKLVILASQKHLSVNKTLDSLVREGLKREMTRY